MSNVFTKDQQLAAPFGGRLCQLANECVGGDNRGAEMIVDYPQTGLPHQINDILINIRRNFGHNKSKHSTPHQLNASDVLQSKESFNKPEMYAFSR